MATRNGLFAGRRRLPPWLERALSIAVIAGDGPDVVGVKRLLTAVLRASLITSTYWALQMDGFGAPMAALGIGSTVLVSGGALAAMWIQPRAYPGVMHFRFQLSKPRVSISLR